MKIHGTAKGGALSHKDYGVAFGKSETFIEASGGTETTDGDYKVHKFTSSGDFEVTAVGSNDTVQYIIVASGGGGGAGYPTFSGRGGGGVQVLEACSKIHHIKLKLKHMELLLVLVVLKMQRAIIHLLIQTLL